MRPFFDEHRAKEPKTPILCRFPKITDRNLSENAPWCSVHIAKICKGCVGHIRRSLASDCRRADNALRAAPVPLEGGMGRGRYRRKTSCIAQGGCHPCRFLIGARRAEDWTAQRGRRRGPRLRIARQLGLETLEIRLVPQHLARDSGGADWSNRGELGHTAHRRQRPRLSLGSVQPGQYRRPGKYDVRDTDGFRKRLRH